MEYCYNIYNYDYILTRFRKAQKTFFIITPIPFIYSLKSKPNQNSQETKERIKYMLKTKVKNILSFNACLLTTYIKDEIKHNESYDIALKKTKEKKEIRLNENKLIDKRRR